MIHLVAYPSECSPAFNELCKGGGGGRGEREREREREREGEGNMFWVFGSRSVRQAGRCLVLFSLSKEYSGS